MRKDLLERLATLLETDAANPKGVKFDLRAWARKSSSGYIYDFTEGEPVPVDCGTSACALGLAAISGAFKDEGLTYQIIGNGRLTPTYGRFSEYRAAAELFQISFDNATELFDPAYYGGHRREGAAAELEVARRVRQLMTEGVIVIPHDDR